MDEKLRQQINIQSQVEEGLKMNYLNCVRCGLCLSNCPQYINNRNERVTPRSIMIHLSNGDKEEVNNIALTCKDFCESDCEGLVMCPMGIELKNLLVSEERINGNRYSKGYSEN